MTTLQQLLIILLIVLAVSAGILGWLIFCLKMAAKHYTNATREYEHAEYNYSLAFGKHAEEYIEAGDLHVQLADMYRAHGDKWARRGMKKVKVRA